MHFENIANHSLGISNSKLIMNVEYHFNLYENNSLLVSIFTFASDALSKILYSSWPLSNSTFYNSY